jgi:hypothetical protein
MRRLARVGVAIMAACLVVTALGAANPYTEVSAKELVAKPQMFWAQGIVFRDTLKQQPSGATRTLGDRKVYRIETQVVGPCYADAVLEPALKDIKPGTACLFVGTVYQQRGWFSSKFHVVIQQVTASVGSLPELGPRLQALQEATSNQIYATTSARLDALLQGIHADLLTYAASSNIALDEVLAPGSLHAERVRQSVRIGINRLENDLRAPSAAFFTDLVTAMIAQRYVVAGEDHALRKPAATETGKAPEAVETLHIIKTEVAEKPGPGPVVQPEARNSETPEPEAAPKPARKAEKAKSGAQKKTDLRPAGDAAASPAATNSPTARPVPARKAESSGSFFGWLFGGSSTNKQTKDARATNVPATVTNKVAVPTDRPATSAATPEKATADQTKSAAAKEKAEKKAPAGEVKKQAAPEPKKTARASGGSFWSGLFGGGSSTNTPKAAATATPAKAVETRKAESAKPEEKQPAAGTLDQAVPVR